jgi:hypothetical protein
VWAAHCDATRADHLFPDAGACCASCAAQRGCNTWVFCAAAGGCAQGSRAQGECWLKHAAKPAKPELAVRSAALS